MLSDMMGDIEFFLSRKRLKKAGGFYSSKWNFIKRIEIEGLNGIASYLMFGSGPFIHIFFENRCSKTKAVNNDYLAFCARLCVFEATGTHVQGIEYLGNGGLYNAQCLIWGGPYFAIVQVEKMLLGGILCRQDVLSAGKQIVTAKVFEDPIRASVFDLYFTDGTMQKIRCSRKEVCIGDPWELSLLPSMILQKTLRLPLISGETITAAFTSTEDVTVLGTSRGRLLSIMDSQIVLITESILSFAIKQIVIAHETVFADVPTLLLFENGSIVSWFNQNYCLELNGRFTYISEFIFELKEEIRNGEGFLLAGDRDGNVSIILVGGEMLEIFRTVRGRTFSAVTCMEVFNRSHIILGTEAGELQWFDMKQMTGDDTMSRPSAEVIENYNYIPPPCVADSNPCYRASTGWYYLKDNKLWKTLHGDLKFPKLKQNTVSIFQRKKLRMKYLACTGVPDREIVVAYTAKDFYCRIQAYTPRPSVSFVVSYKIKDDSVLGRIVQVITMPTHILVQYDNGCASIDFIDTAGKKLSTLDKLFKTASRVTAAACIEYDKKYEASHEYRYDLMIAYLNGKVDVHNIICNSDASMKNTKHRTYVADLKGSYFVSAIASGEHIGNMQSLLLSRKGIVYLTAKGIGEDTEVYNTILQQNLSGILGHGHSLIETYIGILATGFKRHTLHVCRLFMGIQKTRTYCHLFSVDTGSSRLPFTILEEKLEKTKLPVRENANQLIVSYYDKNKRVAEGVFAYFEMKNINGTKHTGIITDCLVQDNFKGIKEYFYSGDTNGNFCIWSFDDKAVTGQTHLTTFKLNGAITGIKNIDPYIAVTTSQGDLHLYKSVNIEAIQLLPNTPYKLGLKITCLTRGWNPSNNEAFLLAFLADGTIKYIKAYSNRTHGIEVGDVVTENKILKFPVAVKAANCWNFKKKIYIMILGVDGILRRTQLSPTKNITVQTKWNLSVIKIGEGRADARLVLAGDHQGWVYLLMTNHEMALKGHVDCLHKHEIIDVAYHSGVLFSLDVGGIVVIRNISQRNRPDIWSCAIPSPRKIVLIEGERKIMIIGRGVAAKSY